MQAAEDSVVVEPYIRGHDASVYVIDGFRGQEHYTLPPVKAVIGDIDTHITEGHKLDEASLAQCPAPFSYEVKKKLEDAAREVHKQLKLAHYSKVDFRVTPNGVYVIEANAHPNIGASSMLGSALDVVGSSLGDFYHHIIDRAYRFKK
jgi:D-alanine-D-alanine ligase